MLRFVSLDRVFQVNQNIYHYIAIFMKIFMFVNIFILILFFCGMLKNFEGKKLKSFMFSTSFLIYYILSGFFFNFHLEEIFFSFQYFKNFRVFNIIVNSMLVAFFLLLGII